MTSLRTLAGGEELSTVEALLAASTTLPTDTDNVTVAAVTEGDIQLQITRIALAAICIVLIAVAIVGNVIVICAILHTPYLRRLNNYLIVSLSLADLGTAIFCMPFFVMELFYNYKWPLSHVLCALYASVEISFGLLSVFTLAAISCERVFLITKPMVYQRIVTELRLIGFIVILWAFSFCYGFLQIAWFYTDSYREWSIANPNMCRYLPTKEYTVFAFVIAFVLPLCIMLGAYMKIFCVVRGQIQRIRPGPQCATDDGFSEEFSTPYPERARSDRIQSTAGLPTIRSRENSLEKETIKEATSDHTKLVMLVDDIGEDVMQIIKCSNSNDKAPEDTKVLEENKVTEEVLGRDSDPQQGEITLTSTSTTNNIENGAALACKVALAKDNDINTPRSTCQTSVPNNANGNDIDPSSSSPISVTNGKDIDTDTHYDDGKSLEDVFTTEGVNSDTQVFPSRGGGTPYPQCGTSSTPDTDRGGGEEPPGHPGPQVTITVQCPVDELNPINSTSSEQLSSSRTSTLLGTGGVPGCTTPLTTAGVIPEPAAGLTGVNSESCIGDLQSPPTRELTEQEGQSSIVNNVADVYTQQGIPTDSVSNYSEMDKGRSPLLVSSHSGLCSNKVHTEQGLTPEISEESSTPKQRHIGEADTSETLTTDLTSEEQQHLESRQRSQLSTASMESKKSCSLHSKSPASPVDSPTRCSTPKCSVLNAVLRTPSPNPSTSAQRITNPSTSAQSITNPSTSAQSITNPSTSAQSITNPSTSAQSITNPSTSAQSITNPSTSAQSITNPSTSAQSITNPSTSAQSITNPSTSAQSITNPSTSAQSITNPSTSAQSITNPSTSAQSITNPSTSAQSITNPSTSAQSITNPSTSAQSIIHIAVSPAASCNSATLEDSEGVSNSELHFCEVTKADFECQSLYSGEGRRELSLAPPEGRVRSSSCNEVITHLEGSARGLEIAAKQTPVRRVSSASELPLLEKLRCMKTEPFRLHSVLKKPSSSKSSIDHQSYPLHQKRNSVQFKLYEGAVLESPAGAAQALRAVLVDDDTTGSSEGNTTETSVSSTHPQKGLTPQRRPSGESGEECDTPSHRHTLQWARKHFNINQSAFMTSNASLSTRMNSVTMSESGISRWSRRRRSTGLFENKAVRMTSYVIGAFVLCWVPYQMCMMLRLFAPHLVPNIVWNVTTVIMFMSTAVNPFIYNFYSSQFRAATRKLLRCQTNISRIHPE